jgi:hypothetical protein
MDLKPYSSVQAVRPVTRSPAPLPVRPLPFRYALLLRLKEAARSAKLPSASFRRCWSPRLQEGDRSTFNSPIAHAGTDIKSDFVL